MSSDSDEEVAKKPKTSGVRARRGFSRKLANKQESLGPIAASSAVYSTCASKCFNNIKSNSVAEEVKRQLTECTNDDVEDNITSICTAQPSVPELKKKDTVLLLSDDESPDENSQDLLNTPSCSRNTNSNAVKSPPSPTPPSPPPELSAKARKRRGGKMKKTLMSAVSALQRNLSDAKTQLKETKEFQSPEVEDVYVIDDDDEVTVRVDICGSIFRYILGPEETLSSLVSCISAEQRVEEHLIMLVYKDKTLCTKETPMSIKLHPADIIKCHIMTEDQAGLNDSLSCDNSQNVGDDIVQLVLQTRGSKHRDLINMPRDKPMVVLMKKYLKLLKQREQKSGKKQNKDETDNEALARLHFVFDGDILGQTETPESLDMDDGDIIDVNYASVTVIG